MKAGKISERGTFSELNRRGLDFASVTAKKKDKASAKSSTAGGETSTDAPDSTPVSPAMDAAAPPATALPSDSAASLLPPAITAPASDSKEPIPTAESKDEKSEPITLHSEPNPSVASPANSTTPASATAAPATGAAPSGKLIEEETRAEGNVTTTVYKEYARANYGYLFFLLIIFFLILFMAASVATSYWLAYWSDNVGADGEDTTGRSANFYLNVYNIISGVSIVLLGVASLMNALSGLESARVFHERLLHSMFRAPMQCTSRLRFKPFARICLM